MLSVGRLQQLVGQLQARAHPPVSKNLISVLIGGAHVGEAQPAAAKFIAQQVGHFSLDGKTLALPDGLDKVACSELLAEAALKLNAAGLIGGWRNEMLAVGNPPVAMIERAACRALGITTEAVHLNAYVEPDTMVVARRSAHKHIDPGLWDNLAGGMVPAGESLQQALARETLEEAGLSLDGFELQSGRSFQVRRAVPEGLQSEIIHVYDTTLPADALLKNQDGEVDLIERRALEDLITAIEHQEFTLESALVILESITRRRGIDTPPGLFR